MSGRPRRTAAAKAKETISVHARWANTDSLEPADPPTMASRRSGRAAAGADQEGNAHRHLTVKLSSDRLRQAPSNRRSESFEGGAIVHGKRNRGGKKNYVVDSSPDDLDEDEEDEGEEDDDAEIDDEDEDAEGEDAMDVDAEGEEEDEVPNPPTRPTIKVSRSQPRSAAAPAAAPKASAYSKNEMDDDDDDDDDDDLSDPGDSDRGDETTIGVGDVTMADEDAEGEEVDEDEDDEDAEGEDAEGEEIEVAGEEEDEEDDDDDDDAEGAGPGDTGFDSDGSRPQTPDLDKMTKRQRARFEDEPQQYMKLSDEVQVKKHFTAEELSMRRQEMARRRRNLSEKRTEEVKMETINKLLKKQAPKMNRKAAAAAANAELEAEEGPKVSPAFVRWVSNKDGSRAAAPKEMLESTVGHVFGPMKGGPRKMVEEVQ